MICPKCRNSEHLEGARFCMICGASLEGCEGCDNEKKGRDTDCCWNCSRNRLTNRKDLFRCRPVTEIERSRNG